MFILFSCKETARMLLSLRRVVFNRIMAEDFLKALAADVYWFEQNLLSWSHRSVHGNTRTLVFGNHDDDDDYENDDNDGSNHAWCCQPGSPTKLILAVKPIACWDKSSWDVKCGYQTEIIMVPWRNGARFASAVTDRTPRACWELLLQAVTDTSDPATQLKPTFVNPQRPRLKHRGITESKYRASVSEGLPC